MATELNGHIAHSIRTTFDPPDISRGLLLKLEQGSNSRQYPGWPYAENRSGPESPVFQNPLRHYPMLSYEAGITPRFIVLTPILLIKIRYPAEGA